MRGRSSRKEASCLRDSVEAEGGRKEGSSRTSTNLPRLRIDHLLISPGITEYRTRDLYSHRENHPGRFTYRGQTDDLIVLSDGEKVNPIPLEDIIGSHPFVKAPLVISEHRFIPSPLVKMDAGSFQQTESASWASGWHLATSSGSEQECTRILQDPEIIDHVHKSGKAILESSKRNSPAGTYCLLRCD